jgi:hypothetical protein
MVTLIRPRVVNFIGFSNSLEESRYKIMSNMLTSFSRWRKQIKTAENDMIKEDIERLKRWNLIQIKSLFYREWLAIK